MAATKGYRKRSNEEWRLIRLQYESANCKITLADVATTHNISLSSVQHRSSTEGWKRNSSLADDAKLAVQNATALAIGEAAKSAADVAAKQLVDDLQPWIAQQKTLQIKRSVARSLRHQDKIDAASEHVAAPKDISFLVSAEDKIDGIIRRNLGMNEGAAAGGSLSLNILTSNAAVQVVQNPPEST